MLRQSLCSISIDLDSIFCYEQIHGLPSGQRRASDPIFTLAMPRFLALFEKWNVQATFFVVGQDIKVPAHAEILQEAVAKGHELANHSYSHPYHLTLLSKEALREEIIKGDDAISSLLPDGQKVVGFRCPGYHITPDVLDVLRAQQYQYDSSIFPCPPYLLARAAMIGWIALRGRKSRSLVGSVETLWTPTQPYHPDQNPHRKGCSNDLWEIPMSVVPISRLPYIGTFVYLYPKSLLGWMTRQVTKSHPLLNFEWHGIDLLDSTDAGVESIASHQPDLKMPLEEKLSRFEICLENISRTHSFQPLCEAVHRLNKES